MRIEATLDAYYPVFEGITAWGTAIMFVLGLMLALSGGIAIWAVILLYQLVKVFVG
jgi:hypothetical protein